MSTPDLRSLLGLATRLAHAAGAELLTRQDQVSLESAQTKSSGTDPVSAADRASEQLIVDGLQSARPGDGLLGEEGAREKSTTGLTWVIDPLDGTVNYLYGRPDWCVSIAVQDARGALVGVVHQPMTGITWSAVRGAGASRDGRYLKVREGRQLAEALVATGFSYLAERRAEQAEYLRQLLPAVRDLRRGGSAALDLCSVADGTADAYYEHVIQPWDVAAGGLIAREAGARTIGGPGTSLPGGLLAAPPDLAESIERLVQSTAYCAAPGTAPRRTGAKATMLRIETSSPARRATAPGTCSLRRWIGRDALAGVLSRVRRRVA